MAKEEAESRAYRRIVDALERDDIDVAAVLGQVPDSAWHAGQPWWPKDEPCRPQGEGRFVEACDA
jgi:hypothetical protein